MSPPRQIKNNNMNTPRTDAQKCCEERHTSLAMICGCPCHTTSSDWATDFMDFYLERGGYKGRKLGPSEYIHYIDSLLRTEIANARRDALKSIQIEIDSPVTPEDIPPFPSAESSKSAREGFITGVAWRDVQIRKLLTNTNKES